MKATARIRARCGNWRLWAAQAVALAAVLTACGPVRAFYWHDWPGSQVRVQQTLITPQRQTEPANPPSVTPPVIAPLPQPGTPRITPLPIGPVPLDRPPIGPPEQTPEPATGLLGLLGLGAFAAVRRWRKK